MIAILDTPTTMTPIRRGGTLPVPVLIRIPNLAPSRSSRRRARRRLRREVRVAVCVMLALLPASLVFTSIGGDALPRLAASSLTVVEPAPPSHVLEAPSVSLSLEPVAPAPRELETRVFLPGILLPADSIEEDGDGRH